MQNLESKSAYLYLLVLVSVLTCLEISCGESEMASSMQDRYSSEDPLSQGQSKERKKERKKERNYILDANR